MQVTSIEKIYTVEGTDKEVREFKNSLQSKYEDVTTYSTPYNHRVVCHQQINDDQDINELNLTK